MKITREQRDQNISLLKVLVDEKDYGEAVDKMLRDYKRKANIPGFRPGMVPMGVIRKMYGKGAVAEQSYRTASNAVFEYLQKEGIDYVGDVIPSEEQGDFDFDNNTEHEFIFEIGEAPEVNIELSEKDELTYYKIKIDEKMHAAFKDNYLRRYGRLVDVDAVKKDEALTVVLDNGDMRIEDAYVGLISMSDEERKPFIGKKVGDKMEVDVNELYKTPSQRAAVLQVKENELEGVNPKFELEIKQIRRFANPELNEEFAKKVGSDSVEAYRAKVRERLEKSAASRSRNETENAIVTAIAQGAKAEIPDAMVEKQEDYAMQRMEYSLMYQGIRLDDYLKYVGQTREEYKKNFEEEARRTVLHQLIVEKLIKELNITASEEEIAEKVAEQAASVGKEAEEYRKSMDPRQLEYIEGDIKVTKLFDYLEANNEMVAPEAIETKAAENEENK